MTLERCPPSAWNRVRHRVEYAAAGLIFGKLFKRFGLRTIPIGFAAACLSQWLFATGTNFYAFAAGEFLLGFGALGLAFAGLCMASGKSVAPEKSPLVMSITMTCMNAGTFASPLIFSGVMSVAGLTSMRVPFWIGVVCFAALTVISLILMKAVPARRRAAQGTDAPVPLHDCHIKHPGQG